MVARTGLMSLVILLAANVAWAGGLSDAGFKKLKKQIAVAAANGDDAELAARIADLAHDDSKRAVDVILKTALMSKRGMVLGAATEAFQAMSSEEAVEALCAKLEKKSAPLEMKILCIDGLGAHSDARSGEALGAALKDKRPQVLRAAVKAARKRREVKAVDALIDLWAQLQKKPDALLDDEVSSALIEITGKYFETVEDWRKFWDTVKSSFRPTTGDSVEAGLTTSERKAKKKPTFFGSEIVSERLVFVIDTSGSMEGGRLAKCKEQLSQCINGLSPKSRFTIVGYSHKIKVWNPKLLVANPKNKKKAQDFVNALVADGWTHTLTALKEGFAVEGADAIVFLSDGIPTEENEDGERLSTDFILGEVDGENRFKKWRIDCFGFGTQGQLGKFMRDLAEQNGGKFKSLD